MNRHHLNTLAATLAIAAPLAASAQTGPIRVGVVTPLSGTYAGIGQQVKWGLDLAAAQINAAGGVMGRKLELLYEDEEANPAVATQKAEKLFQVGKVDFLTGTVNSGSTLAVGQVAERNNRLIATTVSFADSITADKCSPNVFRVNARAGMQSAALADWMASTQKNANVFYLGPDYEMGRSTVAAFKAAAEGKGAKTVGEVFAPLDNKDYSPYFGQIRGARPTVIYTSVAGNDTVRLFTQMAEFGVNRNVQVVGASGTVTSQNLAAIGKAADGFVTGVGYSPSIDGAGEPQVRRRLRGERTRASPTCTAPTPMACCSSTRRRWRRPGAPTPTRCARRCAACSGPRRRARRPCGPATTRRCRTCTP
jgi:branched-chain amino acid transport system substrate-binding protein